MIPYALKAGYIPQKDHALYKDIARVIDEIPAAFSLPSGKELSCHLLAKVLSRLFRGVECFTGYFCGSYRHSWLKTKSKHIIDVYPVATGSGPTLLEGRSALSPWSRQYIFEGGSPLRRHEKWSKEDYCYTWQVVRSIAVMLAHSGAIKYRHLKIKVKRRR